MTLQTPLKYIKLNDVQLSFSSLFERKIWERTSASAIGSTNEPKFEATFILDPVLHSTELTLINTKIEDLLIANHTTRAKVQSQFICLKDGNTLENPQYTNKYIIKTKSREPVVVLDKDAITRIEQKDNKLYPGCYVSCYLDLFLYHNRTIGIGANLRSVQFRRDGNAESFVGSYEPIEDDLDESSHPKYDTVKDFF